LRDVHLQDFPVSYTDNPFLTGEERRRLKQITNSADAAQRRALLWSHLAETIEANRDSLLVVRYEDLIADPNAEIRRIVSALPSFHLPELNTPPLMPRSRRHLLDVGEVRTICDICSNQARYFGYEC
jgi:hypothetical protein